MARGNQREKAREKNQKAQAGVKNKNNMSGAEFQRAKEDAASIMRAKQAAGTSSFSYSHHFRSTDAST
ncbi:4F5 domain protein, partial [Phyllosticta capitalensis]